MGTWDYGLLDNDSAADAIDDVMADVLRDATRLAKTPLSRQNAGAFAAQLGLLAHYRSWLFEIGEVEKEHAAVEALRGAVTRNRAVLDQVAPTGRPLLTQIASGEPLPDNPPFPTLLRATHARAYLQDLADAAIEEVADNLEDGACGAHLDLLRVLSPYVELPAKAVRHWLKRFKAAFADADDDERKFLRAYVEACKRLVHNAAEDDADEDDADEDDGDEDREDD